MSVTASQSPKMRAGASKLMRAIFRSRPTPLSVDVAVIPVRIALAWIFVYYGAGKLFGAFNGPGIHRSALFFSQTAHLRPGGFFAVVAGIIEFGGAIAVAVGFCSRLAALALFGDQVMAMITVTWANGINAMTTKPGYEFDMALAVMALMIVALGAGRVSIDSVIERRLLTPVEPGTSDSSHVVEAVDADLSRTAETSKTASVGGLRDVD